MRSCRLLESIKQGHSLLAGTPREKLIQRSSHSASEFAAAIMPYPLFRPGPTQKPVISRPLPLRTYQDQEQDTSRWSMSDTSEDPEDAHSGSNFWPTLMPTIPPKSPLRTRFARPNAPPALTRNFHLPKQESTGPDQYFGEAMHSSIPAITTTTITTTSHSSGRSLTDPPASAPPCKTTFSSADLSFSKWLAATVGHQHRLAQRETSTSRLTDRELPPPPPPPKDRPSDEASMTPQSRCDSVYDYTDYLQSPSSQLTPPPSPLSLCNSSGWSCVARRTRSP